MSDNAKLVLKVFLSLFAFGLTWAVSNQAAVITTVSIMLVWVINVAFKRWRINLGRAYLTGILWAISFGLVVIFNPGVLPAWPNLDDPSLALSAIYSWTQMVVVALFPYSGAAMTIYNILAQDVLQGVAKILPMREPF
jgi:hypothetical protein